MKKRVLVTGGGGTIGSNLIRELIADGGYEVLAIDNLSSGREENLVKSKRFSFYQGDILDDDLLHEVFSQRIETVFHLAAFFANQRSIEYPETDLKSNVLGTLRLLEHCRTKGIKRFVFSSSSCVYKPSIEPLSEINPTGFETPYSLTKRVAEQYVNFYTNYHKIESTILRFFNPFGPFDLPGSYRNVIPNFIYKALRGESLLISGTGEESRCFCYVGNIVRGTIDASESNNAINETINLGIASEVKIITLAETINLMCNNEGNIRFIPKRNWDTTLRRIPCLDKAESLLNYKATVGFAEGLALTKKWFVDNRIHEREFT